MKTMEVQEMRAVAGGRWKCTTCGTKYLFYIQAVQHCNCEAHYKNGKVSKSVKWCW